MFMKKLLKLTSARPQVSVSEPEYLRSKDWAVKKRNKPDVPLPNRWTGTGCDCTSFLLDRDEAIFQSFNWSCAKTVRCWKSPLGRTCKPEGLLRATWQSILWLRFIVLNVKLEISFMCYYRFWQTCTRTEKTLHLMKMDSWKWRVSLDPQQ
jgi:hypothetical protein